MNRKQEKITSLIEQIDAIIVRASKKEKQFEEKLSKVHPQFKKSARNLIHYRALRMADMRALQKNLGNMGLSRLARLDSHVMASLVANKNILESLQENSSIKFQKPKFSFKESHRQEKRNAKTLLGYRSDGRLTRIMVTIPTEAAQNYQLVHDMIDSGMNCARINCAHDDTVVWEQMIENIRTASEKLNRKCKVAMDLGGPKIRTGALTPGPKVRKFRPTKNVRGEVTDPCIIWLGKEPPADSNLLHLPVHWEKQNTLTTGNKLFFKDARKKKREFMIAEIGDNGCIVHCYKTIFMETGMKLYSDSQYSSQALLVAEIPPIEQPIILHIGDKLRLLKENIPGANAQIDKKGNKKTLAHISCTFPKVLQQVKKGESVFFDDGKIEGIFREVKANEAIIEIVHALENGSKLRADKGINLPASKLRIRGLTTKDKKDLEFVVQHADVVNLSFVNSPQDVRDLLKELRRLKASQNLGIILKIETQSGFNQLTEILLEAMQVHPLGVMIARGDLAIECGWQNIARIQKEILTLCQAALVPVIWATQVLENLSKQGIPSRAEITDAAMAQRTDGVMLNKGPFIIESIQLLDKILKDLAPFQEKNEALLPKMGKADNKVGS